MNAFRVRSLRPEPEFHDEVAELMAGNDTHSVKFYEWANGKALEVMADIDMSDDDCTGFQIVLALLRGETDKAQRWAETLYSDRITASAYAACIEAAKERAA